MRGDCTGDLTMCTDREGDCVGTRGGVFLRALPTARSATDCNLFFISALDLEEEEKSNKISVSWEPVGVSFPIDTGGFIPKSTLMEDNFLPSSLLFNAGTVKLLLSSCLTMDWLIVSALHTVMAGYVLEKSILGLESSFRLTTGFDLISASEFFPSVFESLELSD